MGGSRMPKGQLSRVPWPGKSCIPFTFQPALRALQQPHKHSHPLQLATSIPKVRTRKLADSQDAFISSSDRLGQICLTPSQWFSHKTAFFPEWFTSLSLSYRIGVSWGGSNYSLKNYGFLCEIFSSCVRMCTKHLAMKCNYCASLLN